jgi:hypothetical protein
MWILFVVIIVAALITGFAIIARKGRALRKSQPLPPRAKEAFIKWEDAGQTTQKEVEVPFYFGKSPECDVVLPNAQRDFEACIFEHRERFALETLDGADVIYVNGSEMLAGYLWDGDVLKIKGRNFTFHCF